MFLLGHLPGLTPITLKDALGFTTNEILTLNFMSWFHCCTYNVTCGYMNGK